MKSSNKFEIFPYETHGMRPENIDWKNDKNLKIWKCGFCHRNNRTNAYEIRRGGKYEEWVCSEECINMYILSKL